MKWILFAVLLAVLVLSACAPVPTATPMATTTAILTATSTPTSTAIPTVTATSTATSTVPPTSTPEPTGTPHPPTLRELADKNGIKVGTLIDPQARYWENPAWRAIAVKEFNSAVISIFWHQMMPQQGKIDFGLPDGQLKVAQSGNMEVRAQTLVYSFYLPDWIKDGSFTREQLIGMIQDNIKTIMTRYKGSITKWNVVNEAGFFPPYDSTDFFYHHIGQEYVEIAFQAARQADPSALLYLDDFGVETTSSSKYKQDKQIVDSLKQKNLIDAMGVQLHIDAAKPPKKEDLIAGFRSWGLPVYVTEFDVDLRNVTGTEEQRFKLQADIYRMAMQAALESGVCKDIVFWGFGDKYSWLEQPEFNGSPQAQPTLFDDNLQPKPAYFAVRDVLSGQ